MNDKILSLQQFYLQILCATIKAEKYEPAIQEFEPGLGQLWLLRGDSTAAAFRIAFKFGPDTVTLGTTAPQSQVDGQVRELVREIPYFEGLESYLKQLTTFLRAGQITDQRKAA